MLFLLFRRRQRFVFEFQVSRICNTRDQSRSWWRYDATTGSGKVVGKVNILVEKLVFLGLKIWKLLSPKNEIHK
jgi:hypothetical protein